MIDKAKELAFSIMRARQAAMYRSLFFREDGELSHWGEKVLADLNRFCRGNESAFDPDPRRHALLEGRREVLLRILGFLKMDSDEISKFVEVIHE